ncbi:MAG: hypothetical protein WBV73_11575 [Phormidium sp.]
MIYSDCMTFQCCFVLFWEMRSLKFPPSYEMLMYNFILVLENYEERSP